MRRIRLSAVLSAGLTALAMSAVTVVAGGFAGAPAGSGRETLKIVSTTPGPWHPPVYAKGVFTGKGYFVRKKANIIFPQGRLAVTRHLLGTSYSPPNLATCWFKAQQTGTFQVFYSTGKYRGFRWSGDFWTNISGKLKRTGADECSSKIVYYRAVTYEVGTIP